MAAGELQHRLRFERRRPLDDGHGNKEGGWRIEFEHYAGLKPLRGSETVIAQRLAGIQPVIIKVRQDSRTREITTGWRAVDRFNNTYNIRSIADMEQRRQYFEIMAESGGTDG